MNKRIGLLLISEAYPKPLARWNCEAIYKEMCNFIKEHKMQEKVTLKVGDKISEYNASRVWETDTISSFEDGKTVWLECGNCYSMSSEKYYVNGKRYARENIIVPDFKKENKMEYQEITPENIAEVLKFNGIDKKLYTVQAKHIDCYTKCGNYCDIFNFNNQLWLQLVEVHFGKLKPLPKANPFDVVKVGDWVKSKKTLYHYQCQLPYRTKDKWYQRVELNNKKCFVCNSNGSGYSSSDSPCDWDLTDIRDYNPTECELKVGDEIITKNGYGHEVHSFGYSNEILYLGNGAFSINFKNINKVIESVNGKKYDKITIPSFDFVKCLMDAGFIEDEGVLFDSTGFITLIVGSNTFYLAHRHSFPGQNKQLTPANAKILIQMAKLAEGLK